jgi:hypothetical protein
MGYVLFLAAVTVAVSLVTLLAIAWVSHPTGRIPLDLDAFCRGVSRETSIPDPHVLVDDEWVPCDPAKRKAVNFLKVRLNPQLRFRLY